MEEELAWKEMLMKYMGEMLALIKTIPEDTNRIVVSSRPAMYRFEFIERDKLIIEPEQYKSFQRWVNLTPISFASQRDSWEDIINGRQNSKNAMAITAEYAEKLGEQGVDYLDCPVSGGEPGAIKATLAFMAGGEQESFESFRELGLALFLAGAGTDAGQGFVAVLKEYGVLLVVLGAIITVVPMFIAFVLAKFAFRLETMNTLGSICGGMTSTPALGTLMEVAKSDAIAAAYAATYPVALVMVVLSSQSIALIFG